MTVHLSRDSVKFCVLLKGFILASWDSDLKIVYKIRKECFYSPVIFWTGDILPSTLNLLPFTLDILPSTLHILPSALDLRPLPVKTVVSKYI